MAKTQPQGTGQMTTVTAVKRALEEAAETKPLHTSDMLALQWVARSPEALTILANRLSDRGEAGNDAVKRNLADLERIANNLRFTATRVGQPGCAARLAAEDQLAALQWAIDQLTPPEVASYISPGDCPTEVGRACQQGERCCQLRPGR